MELFEIIEDKASKIDGMIIHKEGEKYNILWSNGVVGVIDDNMSDLKSLGKRNVRRFIIEDLLHTGHHGPEGYRKEGAEYDKRRNMVLLLDYDFMDRGRNLCLHLYSKRFFQPMKFAINPQDDETVDVYTTPFEKIYNKDGKTMLKTLNSIYVLEEF